MATATPHATVYAQNAPGVDHVYIVAAVPTAPNGFVYTNVSGFPQNYLFFNDIDFGKDGQGNQTASMMDALVNLDDPAQGTVDAFVTDFAANRSGTVKLTLKDGAGNVVLEQTVTCKDVTITA